VPHLNIGLLEVYTQQVLVNLQDRRHHHIHGEVLFNQGIIEVESALNIEAVIIPIVPDVELSIEG
jgi:hypothetical protein